MSDVTEPIMIPKARLDEEIAKRTTLEQELQKARQERDSLNSMFNENLSRIKTENEQLRKSYEETSLKYKTDTALQSHGVQDKALKDFVLYQYGQAKDAEGKQPEFDKWLNTYKTENSVLFGGTIKPSTDVVPPVTQVIDQKPRPVDQTMNGVVVKQDLGSKLAPHELSKLSPAQFKEHQAEILKSLKY